MPRFPLCLEKNTAIHFWGLVKTLLSRPSTHYLYMQHNQDIHEVSIHICLFGHMTLASDKYITFRPQARSYRDLCLLVSRRRSRSRRRRRSRRRQVVTVSAFHTTRCLWTQSFPGQRNHNDREKQGKGWLRVKMRAVRVRKVGFEWKSEQT